MPKYRKLPLEQLFIDKDYQRRMDETRILRMADKYDPERFGTLEVSDRHNDTYAVWDGQHRLLMAEILDMHEVACLVHDFFAEAEKEGIPASKQLAWVRRKEAEMFDTQAEDRRPLRPYMEFRSRVFRGAEPEASIYRLVKASGFTMGESTRPGTIAAVKALTKVYKRYGEDVFSYMLTIAREAWDGAGVGIPGPVIEGLAGWLDRYGAETADKSLIAKLRQNEPDMLVGRARARAARYGAGQELADWVAAEITKLYNTGRRTRRIDEGEVA